MALGPKKLTVAISAKQNFKQEKSLSLLTGFKKKYKVSS
jgi:hypothetical protein